MSVDRRLLADAKSAFDAVEWCRAQNQRVRGSGAQTFISCPHPSHEDRNPSCSLRRYDTGFGFKCFACGASGDSVALVSMVLGCSTGDAIEEIHRVTGIPSAKQSAQQERDAWKRYEPEPEPWHSDEDAPQLDDYSAYAESESEAAHPDPASETPHSPRNNPPKRRPLRKPAARSTSKPARRSRPARPQQHRHAPRTLITMRRNTLTRITPVSDKFNPSTYQTRSLGSAGAAMLDVSRELDANQLRDLEGINDDTVEKLTDQINAGRVETREADQLRTKYLRQRHWSDAVIEPAGVHVAMRPFGKHTLRVMRHTFWGVGGRIVGFSDRLQRKDQTLTGRPLRWLSSKGTSVPVIGLGLEASQPVVVVAEGVSDWVTLIDCLPQFALPLAVPGVARSEAAAARLAVAFRDRAVVVIADTDAAGARMGALLTEVCVLNRTRVLQVVCSLKDVSDVLANHVRIRGLQAGRATFQSRLRDICETARSAQRGGCEMEYL